MARKELPRPNVPPLIHARTVREGFTQSEITDMSCMRRWNWRYNELLEKPGSVGFPFKVGTAFHDAMEQLYKTKFTRCNVATIDFEEGDIPGIADITERDYWNQVLPKMVEAYQIYYKDDPFKWDVIEIEREVDITYMGLRFRGKIDLKIRDNEGIWPLDHKTTSRLNKDVVAGWDFRFQFMFYIWLLSKVEPDNKLKGYYVNAVKKPELRVKQVESLPEFAMRVREDMIINPDKYFYRDKFPITKGALDHFEREVVNPKVAILQFVIDNPGHPVARSIIEDKNTSECQKWGGSPCPYLELCRYGYDQMGSLYRQKEQKHMELNEND